MVAAQSATTKQSSLYQLAPFLSAERSQQLIPQKFAVPSLTTEGIVPTYRPGSVTLNSHFSRIFVIVSRHAKVDLRRDVDPRNCAHDHMIEAYIPRHRQANPGTENHPRNCICVPSICEQSLGSTLILRTYQYPRHNNNQKSFTS